MSSIKCPNCGLTNFATAEQCKRCKQNFESPSYPYWGENGPVEQPKPDWSKLETIPAYPEAVHGDGSHTVGNILFAIYLGISTIFTLISLAALNSRSVTQVWEIVTDPRRKVYLPSYEALYNISFYGAIVFLVIAITLIVTLCLKSELFLRWVMIYLVGKFIYFVLEIWLVFSVEGEMREKKISQLDLMADQIHWLPYLDMILIMFTFIWFRYFTSSKRARYVFQ